MLKSFEETANLRGLQTTFKDHQGEGKIFLYLIKEDTTSPNSTIPSLLLKGPPKSIDLFTDGVILITLFLWVVKDGRHDFFRTRASPR